MRIIIEIDPSDLKPSATVEGVKAEPVIEEALNAGGPPDFLVEALGGKKEPEPEPETAPAVDQNGGAGPAWLAEAAETLLAALAPGGNGGGGGPV